jgi:hypothetical protein
MKHQQLLGSGAKSHKLIDLRLPSPKEKSDLATIAANAPVDVDGARDDPEAALANLLTALAALGLITDSTTAT